MSPQRMSTRARLIRIGGGLGLIALGCATFILFKKRDPANRPAVLAIAMLFVGASLLGQGIRGRSDGPLYHDPPPYRGPPVSAERAVGGIVLAWIVPGLGHWIIDRKKKAVLFFVTITTCFVLGVALAQGRNLNYDRDWVYFLAYMFNGGETAIGWLLTRNLERTHVIPFLQVGFLYTAVACLLNVVVMMDFVSTCGRSHRARKEEETA